MMALTRNRQRCAGKGARNARETADGSQDSLTGLATILRAS